MEVDKEDIKSSASLSPPETLQNLLTDASVFVLEFPSTQITADARHNQGKILKDSKITLHVISSLFKRLSSLQALKICISREV